MDINALQRIAAEKERANYNPKTKEEIERRFSLAAECNGFKKLLIEQIKNHEDWELQSILNELVESQYSNEKLIFKFIIATPILKLAVTTQVNEDTGESEEVKFNIKPSVDKIMLFINTGASKRRFGHLYDIKAKELERKTCENLYFEIKNEVIEKLSAKNYRLFPKDGDVADEFYNTLKLRLEDFGCKNLNVVDFIVEEDQNEFTEYTYTIEMNNPVYKGE